MSLRIKSLPVALFIPPANRCLGVLYLSGCIMFSMVMVYILLHEQILSGLKLMILLILWYLASCWSIIAFIDFGGAFNARCPFRLDSMVQWLGWKFRPDRQQIIPLLRLDSPRPGKDECKSFLADPLFCCSYALAFLPRPCAATLMGTSAKNISVEPVILQYVFK